MKRDAIEFLEKNQLLRNHLNCLDIGKLDKSEPKNNISASQKLFDESRNCENWENIEKVRR